MNLVDTSGWIEYLFGGENAGLFAPVIEDTGRLVVPVICLYEVFKKISAVADEAKALQAVAQMKQGRVVDVTEDIALRAALISLKHRLPMADRQPDPVDRMDTASHGVDPGRPFCRTPRSRIQRSPNRGAQRARQASMKPSRSTRRCGRSMPAWHRRYGCG